MSKQHPILQANDLELGYLKGNVLFPVARNLAFDLYPGQLTCLMGPNGVGKSTLLKAILGSNPPIRGKLTLNKKNIADYAAEHLAKQIAVVLTDKVQTGNMTVYDLVCLGRIPHTGWWGKLAEEDLQAVEKALVSTKTKEIENRKLNELSDGQLQKTMIARALAQDGEVLVLDEPTAHLDLVNRFEIMTLLRELAHENSKAILVVTHDLEIAVETADRLWLMTKEHSLVTGSPEGLMIEGKVNLLVSDNKWHVNPLTGKMELNIPLTYPEITGPAHIIPWIKLAIRKSHPLNDMDSASIIVYRDPFSLKLTYKNQDYHFSSIEKLMHFLKYN
ncbi:ABC transporter ATP-binding protein [Negadavirga shengliensis]|uniref:ABC transporter ATP-binding protein n=1 Tax=Negadavirga shengliensis TaxID=1389218 RepID=A0ABV9T4B7_9BACT